MAASRTEVLLLSLFIESPNFQDVTVFILAVWKYQYNKINSMFLFRVRLLDEGGCQNEWFIFETQVSGLFHYQFCITFWSHFTSFLHWDLFEGLGCLLRLSLVLTIYQGHRLAYLVSFSCCAAVAPIWSLMQSIILRILNCQTPPALWIIENYDRKYKNTICTYWVIYPYNMHDIDFCPHHYLLDLYS